MEMEMNGWPASCCWWLGREREPEPDCILAGGSVHINRQDCRTSPPFALFALFDLVMRWMSGGAVFFFFAP